MLAATTFLLIASTTSPTLVPILTPDTTVAQQVAMARAQLRGGDLADGYATYLAASTRAATPEEWAIFARDLSWIASPGELKAWEATSSAADRTAFLRTFWSERDARDDLPEGGRLAEQVRRLDIAMVRYRIAPRRGVAPVMRASAGADQGLFGTVYGADSPLRDYAPAQGMLDDRGVIFVRHGEPDAITIAAGNRLESWTYEIEGHARTVHFTDAAFDGSSGNGTLVAVAPRGSFAALCQSDPLYCAPAARATGFPPEQAQRVRAASLEAIKVLTTTDAAASKES
ncbi:MAG: hypothetical protein AB7P61_14995 [Gemmatimonadales bacterium]